jgi:thiamine-monophosphate kinase
MTTFKDLGEFGFIDRIARYGLARDDDVLCGIGDDCAVLRSDHGQVLLFTTDTMVEEVHFLSSASQPEDLGYKLLAVNVSDIAAMGGEPRHAVISVAIPPDLDVATMDRFYDGLYECAEQFGVSIAGGDTTRSPGPVALTLSLVGRMGSDRVCYRSGARPGDLIYVSGTLGDSAAGLELVLGRDVPLAAADREHFLRRHHRPEPRVALGRALAESGAVTAMIDLSDGVASDLRHICARSDVSAVIAGASLPLSPAYRAYCAAAEIDPLSLALTGGEDYELLFTVEADRADRLEALGGRDGLPPPTRIGRIEAGDPQVLLENAEGYLEQFDASGYDHFRPGRGGR